MLRQVPRPNSFRNVVADGFGMAAAFSIVATFVLTTTGYSDGPIRDAISDKQALEASDRNKDTSAAAVEQPSGDPTESAADQSNSHMLGMTLELNRSGAVTVTDVAATSPASDTGVRRGDTIVSLAGLKANDLSQWVKDVSKVLHETRDGREVSLEVLRDNKRLSLQVKVPESRAAELRQAQREQQKSLFGGVQQAPMPPVQAPNSGYVQPQAGAVSPGGVAVYPIGGAGFDFGVFGDESNANGVVANRAIAQLMTTGNQTTPVANPADRNLDTPGPRGNQISKQATSDSAGAQAPTGGQVGIAAFQNNAQGVAAYVEVHGLPQGSYLVGLNDGGLSGGVNSPFNTLQQPNSRPNQNQKQTPSPTGLSPVQQQSPNSGNPGPPPAPPQGPRSGASLADPDGSAVLAQQLQQPPNSTAAPNGNPSTQNKLNAANSGPANPTAAQPQQENVPLGSPQFAIPIGRLQVGPDGSAKVQQQLEGTQVQNLAGMMVSVVATQSQGGSGLGPADVNQGLGANRNPSAARPGQGRQPGQANNSENSGQTGTNHESPGANEVVATGLVHLLGAAGNPAASNPPQTGQAPARMQNQPVAR